LASFISSLPVPSMHQCAQHTVGAQQYLVYVGGVRACVQPVSRDLGGMAHR
jgi:hypothetical protein